MDTLRVGNSLLKINSGSSDPLQVAQVQAVNNKPYVNSLTPIFDGNQSQNLPVNFWSTVVPLDSVSNGIQFSPETDGGVINAYDNIYQRHFEYTFDSDDKITSSNGKQI